MEPRSVPLSWVIVAVGVAALLYVSTGDPQDEHGQSGLSFRDSAERREAIAAGFTDPKAWRLEKIARAQAEARAESQRPAKQVMLPAGATSAENCRQTIACIGEKLALIASSRCKTEIERQARFSAEWSDGPLEPKFSRYRWTDRMGGAVTVIGDRLRFQNGFGAWQTMIYECDIDPTSEAPLSARVREGRL